MCVIDSEPLVEQDNNASHVYENDDFGVGEGVVLGAIEGSDEGDCEGDGKGVGQGAFEADGEREDVDWQDVDEVYMVNVKYLSDGERDEELQTARDKSPKKRHDESTQEVNGYETDYYESNDHGSIVESSSKEEHERGARRRKKFPVYNLNNENPKLCLGMLFRDGKTYSKVSRRELKIVTNEPKRIKVKCIASAKCPWRIFASYNKRSKCLQVTSFHEKHNCCVSFKNKMVNFAIISNHFEATIKDHPKMKLQEIQQRVASQLHVNVNLTKCRRAKKKVNKRLAGSFKE
ncbi:hypothetical protein Gotri_026819 [Gossypium trilobum]|uniref:Transposase MuDR plant domain-containing protein n=1 Tax=Gossypium trilobum TaxID=34281 RepID=A0A7J9FN75_9ROSI|nr:hypothetical protein [Gossypium trilobum]